MLNAIKEQQAQIEQQRKQIERQQALAVRQQQQLNALKKLACRAQGKARVCR
jgi:flagellar biosynthesis chaperone FliJ